MTKRTKVGAAVVIGVWALAGTAKAQVPANDTCGNATVLSMSVATPTASISGNTTNATATSGLSGLAGAPTCGSTVNSRDVWYILTCPVAGQLTVDTCTANYDSVVSIHSLCPGMGASQLACDDDACGNLRSRATVNSVSAGQTVLIRVGGYNANFGTFTLTATIAPPPPPPTPPSTPIGPDVVVNLCVDVANYGSATNNNGVQVTAFAVGTDSCNPGDYPVIWVDNNNRPGYGPELHPVIAQNMFRYSIVNGTARFEQVGQSWLKHGFASTNSGGCGSCQQPIINGVNFGGDALGVNCTDTYGSGLNGGQGYLGPRSQVNPATGVFAWPHGSGSGGTVGMRLQVKNTDLASQPAGTRWFADTHYITQDDAQYVRPAVRTDPNPLNRVAINGLNNASYREINAATIGNAAPSFASPTVQRRFGIEAWKAIDSSVKQVNADYLEPNTGFFAGMWIKCRYIVSSKATSLGGGMFRYEYAVYNINSGRAGGSFSVPLPAAAVVSNVGFNAPISHSGEPYSNAPWSTVRSGNTIVFKTDDYNASNPNANAIRWGTMYNFRFDTAVAPTTGDGTITLYAPGGAGEALVAIGSGIDVPTVPSGPTCTQDYNSSGGVDGDDLADYIADFFDSTGIQPGFGGPIAIPSGFAGTSTLPFVGFGVPCPTSPDVPQPNPWGAPANAYRVNGYKVTVGQNNGPCADPNGDDLADFIGIFFTGCP